MSLYIFIFRKKDTRKKDTSISYIYTIISESRNHVGDMTTTTTIIWRSRSLCEDKNEGMVKNSIILSATSMIFLNAAIRDGGFVRVLPVNPTAPSDPVVDLRSSLDHGHSGGHVRTVASAQSFRPSYAGGLVLMQRQAVPFLLLQNHRGRYLPVYRQTGVAPP